LILFMLPVVVGATLLERRHLAVIFAIMVTILIGIILFGEVEIRSLVGNFAIIMALVVVLLDQLLAGYRVVIGQLEARTAALETEIRQREAAQRESTRLTNILENTTDVVAVMDRTQRLVYLNRSGRDLLGDTMEQPARIFPEWALHVFQAEQMPSQFRDGGWQGDVELRVPGEGTIPVSQVVIAEYDRDQIVYLATICRDMRERHNAEKARLKLALQTERLTALREMVDTVTHDIKSPLSSILTNLYMAQRLVDDPTRQQIQLERIQTQIHNIEVMIQDVLTISKMEVAPETTRVQLDLVSLLQRIQLDLSEQIQQKGLTFTIEAPSDLPHVSANLHEIPRVFVNLIENALKYIHPGGEIRIRMVADNGGVRVDVVDNGPGIPPDDLPHIFDRFYRAHNVIDVAGTGLGLAIVKKSIEAHNGSVEIDSTPGEGTVVRVWMPVTEEVHL
jgi:signal transduction histidine kinase